MAMFRRMMILAVIALSLFQLCGSPTEVDGV
jgi:hypothetical protein